MEVKEIYSKKVLGKSKIGDYCVNPFIGCAHGCKYCYAQYYTSMFSNSNKEWGDFVYVKVNAPSLLKKEMKNKFGAVYLSSLTDLYQPLESKYQISRRLLMVLKESGNPVIIQTKSPLVVRDIDILKSMDVEVGLSISVSSEKDRRVFEPNAPPVQSRVNALRELNKEGIKTFAFIGPILPYITNISVLVDAVSSFSDKVYFDKLRLKPGLFDKLIPVVEQNYPNIATLWRGIFSNPLRSHEYWASVKKEISSAVKNYKGETEVLF